VLDGIRRAGGIAVDIGELPTPALYFATHVLESTAAFRSRLAQSTRVQRLQNVAGGEAVFGDAINGCVAWLCRAERRRPAAPTSPTTILSRYRDAIVEHNGPLARPASRVDCGNGVTSLVAIDTLRRLAPRSSAVRRVGRHVPQPPPDPTVPDTRRSPGDRRARGCELGIAFDGDGDRIGAVDEQGDDRLWRSAAGAVRRDLVHLMGRVTRHLRCQMLRVCRSSSPKPASSRRC